MAFYRCLVGVRVHIGNDTALLHDSATDVHKYKKRGAAPFFYIIEKIETIFIIWFIHKLGSITSNHFNMSTVLLIKYAMASCNTDQVKARFNREFKEDIVGFVKEINQVDRYNNKPYKMFFIHFNKSNTSFEQYIALLKTETTNNIYYSDKWYWKVIIADTRGSTQVHATAVIDKPVLLIKYALESCDHTIVRTVFTRVFGDDIIDNITTLDKIDSKTLAPYKMFFINFASHNDCSSAFVRHLQLVKIKKIIYDGTRFWNVVLSEACLKPTPPTPTTPPTPPTEEGEICFEQPIAPTEEGEICFEQPIHSGIVCDVIISDAAFSEIFAEMKLEKRFIHEVAGTPEALAIEHSSNKKHKV